MSAVKTGVYSFDTLEWDVKLFKLECFSWSKGFDK